MWTFNNKQSHINLLICILWYESSAPIPKSKTKKKKQKFTRTYRTLPPQNWHSSPCQPSEQTHVPFMHAPPFIQDALLMHLLAAITCMQQLNNTRTLNTTKTNRHFRCDFIVNDFINIWAKLLSIFKFATFFNAYYCVLFAFVFVFCSSIHLFQ